MMTVEILNKIAEILAADAGIEAWCQEKYGKSPTIWLGVDEEHPPGADDMPSIVIYTATRDEIEANVKTVQWSVHIGCVVSNSEIVANGKTRTFTGMLQSEELRAYVETAILKSLRIGKVDANAESVNINAYPLFQSVTVIRIERYERGGR